MKNKIVVMITVVLTMILFVPRLMEAYASEEYEMLDTSMFDYFSFLDEKFIEEYGEDYEQSYPFAIAFSQRYDDGGFYGGIKTYCVRSDKPLSYDAETNMLVSKVDANTIHGTCSFSKTFGSQTTTLGTGGLYVLPSMTYSANYEIKDSSGTVVFLGAPYQTELAVIVEQATKKITPMKQIIFLVPLLISLVVSFLGLRKAWQMLSNLLRQS